MIDGDGNPYEGIGTSVRFLHPDSLPIGPDRSGIVWRRPREWEPVADDAFVRDPDHNLVVNPTGISVAWWYVNKVRCFCPSSLG
jgi:hypothetical protein